MSTATATTRAPSSPAGNNSTEDLIERRLDLLNVEHAAVDQVLTQIIARHDPTSPFRPDSIDLSATEWRMFDVMKKNVHQACELLEGHRYIQNCRDEAGDPQKLTDARAVLDAAIAAEATERAALADLDVVGDGGQPVLASQIRQLQQRLDDLTAKRRAAELAVGRLESLHATLRRAAPKWLRDQVERDVDAVARTSPLHRELNRLADWLFDVGRMVEPGIWCRHDPTSGTVLNYSICHFPEGVLFAGGKPEKLACDKVSKHFDWLIATEIPRVKAERGRLQAEWDVIVRQVEEPLYRWICTGDV